ncbi:MAG: hypothetical protein HY952_05970 [Elusimicrobia bacterium]|nr:hypothetical protein [Elusimicrobiota bacterium]
MKNILLSFLFLACAAPSGAQVDEAELFSSPDVATQAADTAPAPADKRSVAFSGEVLLVENDVIYSSSSKNPLTSYLVGNLFLDARLKQGVKAFANMETTYRSDTRETKSALREAFLDFNVKNKVYFRGGKQVLQWGRCYLWNPTDLINIEKATFVRRLGYRDGAYGLKMHIPFGAEYNIYGFLDTGNAATDSDLGGALKFEFLTGRTEMAFSGWAKRNRRPVLGYDFSTRLGDVDIAGEYSAARRDNTRFLRDDSGTLDIVRKRAEWAQKAAINFSKGFRLGNYNDRLTVTGEFFYNQTGYRQNVFRDHSVYNYGSPLAALGPTGTIVPVTSGSKRDFLLGHGLYEPNYLSRYYGAIFTSVTRFIIEDMTLSANYIRNLADDSGMLTTGVAYKNMNDFSAGLLVNTFLGPGDREYTFSKAKFGIQATAGIAF